MASELKEDPVTETLELYNLTSSVWRLQLSDQRPPGGDADTWLTKIVQILDTQIVDLQRDLLIQGKMWSHVYFCKLVTHHFDIDYLLAFNEEDRSLLVCRKKNMVICHLLNW